MKNDFLKNVYGYNAIKRELELIQKWYKKSDNDNYMKMLPKGIIFYGEPGFGKTFITREYAKSFGYPIFVIDGDSGLDEITKKYDDAKKEMHAIVIIDELDKLVDKDTKLTRVLMDCLDGFDNSSNILTLATCNYYNEIPAPLLREGRFDRHFYMCYEKEDLKEIIVNIAKDIDIDLTEDEIEELTDVFDNSSIVNIRAVFNNVKLRYGNNYKIDNIIKTKNYLKSGLIDNYESKPIRYCTAVHEAGHALFIYHYSTTREFLRIYFNDEGGCTVERSIDECDTVEDRINSIRTGLAGLISEEIILGFHNVGSSNDLDRVDEMAFRLVNRTCITNIYNYCSQDKFWDREKLCDYNAKIYEKKTSQFLKKSYKIVKRLLKKHKKEILLLANYLMEHRGINRKELEQLLSNNKIKKGGVAIEVASNTQSMKQPIIA